MFLSECMGSVPSQNTLIKWGPACKRRHIQFMNAENMSCSLCSSLGVKTFLEAHTFLRGFEGHVILVVVSFAGRDVLMLP